MLATDPNLTQLVEELGFELVEGDLLVGKRQGFSMGLRIIASEVSAVFLFHIRHPFAMGTSEVSALQLPENIKALSAAKALEVEFEDRLVWVTFSDGQQALSEGMVLRTVDSILEAMQRAGLRGDPETCHYCRREKAPKLSVADGKVAQICEGCLGEKTSTPDFRPAEATDGLLPVALLGPAAGGIGALGWAGLWIGLDLFFESFKSNVVYVPRIFEALMLALVVGVVGGSIGLVFRRVKRRGRSFSMLIAGFWSIGAVILGEVGYVAWLIHREFKVLSFSAAWDILPRLELEMGAVRLMWKALAAVGCVILAVTLSKPVAPRLKI